MAKFSPPPASSSCEGETSIDRLYFLAAKHCHRSPCQFQSNKCSCFRLTFLPRILCPFQSSSLALAFNRSVPSFLRILYRTRLRKKKGERKERKGPAPPIIHHATNDRGFSVRHHCLISLNSTRAPSRIIKRR